MSSAVTATQLGLVPAPVALGKERGWRVQRLCARSTCLERLVRANGSVAHVADASPFFLNPSELHRYYQLPDDSVASTPPTIAVLEDGDDPTAEDDLDVFSNATGLPDCTSASGCFTKANGARNSNSPYNGAYDPGYDGTSFVSNNANDVAVADETAMDLEAAHATCWNCKLMLVEVNVGSDFNQVAEADDFGAAALWAEGQGATVISISYAFTSAAFAMPVTTDPAYTDFAQPGKVVVASTGDAGYEEWGGQRYPAYPAVNPSVIAAGGTTLSANADGTYASEAVWNDSDGASGSACAVGWGSYYAADAWQKNDPHFAAEGCVMTGGPYYRSIADVSADAAPATGFGVYTSFTGSGQWAVDGGTSLSAPLIAGMYGLAGGYPSAALARLGNSCPSGSCAAATLYANENDAVPALHDVTSGNNVDGTDSCSAWTICNAGTGLDGPTGVGTPIGLAAFGGPSYPNATTQGATSVTSDSATLNATVDPVGSSGTIAYFCYGLSDPYTACGNNASIGTSAQSVSQSLTGLSPSTTYHYRIYASGPGGLGIGTDGTFTTSATPPAPAPTPSPVSAPTPSIGTWQAKGPSATTTGSCAGASTTSCTINVVATVTETIKHGKIVAVTAAHRRRPPTTRTVVVASSTVTVAGGQSATITLALNTAGENLMKTRRTLTAKLVTTSGDAVLSTQTATFTRASRTRSRPHKPGRP